MLIDAQHVSKVFRVHHKQPGFRASLKSLFRRTWIEKHALSDVSLSVDRGEIVGLVGANGAGKTTLVKILAGVIHPSSGQARVLGHVPWQRSNQFRHQIALIMGQKAQLWWDLPAADCFLLLKEIYQIPAKEYHERIEFLSQQLDVTRLLSTQIRRLSLGERMKMEIIAALLHNPQVIFLDEPTIGLDLSSQKSLRKFLLEYRQKFSPAIILTSHYMEDIEALCKRLVMIREGSVIYDGPTKDIVEHYATHRTIRVQFEQQVDSSAISAFLQLPSESIELENSHSIRLRLERSAVAPSLSKLFNQWTVLDLQIEETEIGDVVEKLIRREVVHASD